MENFQRLAGSSRRASSRRFCSSLEMRRWNLITTVPLRTRWRSKALMSANLSFQIRFVTSLAGSRCFASRSSWTRTTSTSS